MSRLKEVLMHCEVEESEDKASLLKKYMQRILFWNEKVNLTSISNEEEFEQKHFIDSLACCISEEFVKAKRIIDVGSGGGFPGVPLAIVFPAKEFVLLDSSAKRMDIVKGICDELDIRNVATIHGRAEEAGRDGAYREVFDLCVSRAVAPLNVLLEYCLPLVKQDGSFVAYKGAGFEHEVSEAAAAAKMLGGELLRTEPQSSFPFTGAGCEHHILLFYKKARPTPDKYPRSPGKPAKKPIR